MDMADIPRVFVEFFRTGYPDMQTVEQNVATATKAGYELLATHTMPAAAWVDGYYDILAPRAKALADHPDPGVREFARATSREIEIFAQSEASYGYVFYLLERRRTPPNASRNPGMTKVLARLGTPSVHSPIPL
jgi:serine/threonine-protein kinase HipA